MSLSIRACQNVAETTIILRGRLVMGQNLAQLRSQVRSVLADGIKVITIDLIEVSHIDSNGLGELIANFTSASAAGATFRVVNAHGAVRTALHITKLDTVFEVSEIQSPVAVAC